MFQSQEEDIWKYGGCDGASNVIPIGNRLHAANIPHLFLALANELQVRAAYGESVVEQLSCQLLTLIEDGFGDVFFVTRLSNGLFELRFRMADGLVLNVSEKYCQDLLTSLSAAFAGLGNIGTTGVRAVVIGEWFTPAQRAGLSDADLHGRALRSFSGDHPPLDSMSPDSVWSQRYRADVDLVDEFMAGVCGEARNPGQSPSTLACVTWNPVRLAEKSGVILWHDLRCGIVRDNGELRDAEIYLEAVTRLGLSAVVARLMLLRALEELSSHEGLALCIRVSARAARLGSDFFYTLKDAVAADRALASRLAIELDPADGWSNAAIDGCAAFCDAVRAFGCHLALGDFGTGSGSVRELLAFRPDFVRLDPVLVVGALGEDGDRMLMHLAGIASAGGAVVIADGVQDAGRAAVMTRLGVDWQQGHFWGARALTRPWRRNVHVPDCDLIRFQRESCEVGVGCHE